METARRSDLLWSLANDCLRKCEDRKEFVLHGGGTSPFFLDVPLVLRHAHYAEGIGEQLANLLLTMSDDRKLLSIDTGGTYCAIALQQYLRHHQRQNVELYRIEKSNPRLLPMGSYTIIDDVLTSGSSVLPVIDKLREEGSHVIELVTVVNRREGGGDTRVRDKGVFYSSLFDFEEVLRMTHL